jgi:hypothetical protein
MWLELGPRYQVLTCIWIAARCNGVDDQCSAALSEYRPDRRAYDSVSYIVYFGKNNLELPHTLVYINLVGACDYDA